MAGFFREVARRIFAQELKDSNLASRDESDQYAPQYVMTPTGAKVNRIFLVGTLTKRKTKVLIPNTGGAGFQTRQVPSLSMPDSTSPKRLSFLLIVNCQFLWQLWARPAPTLQTTAM